MSVEPRKITLKYRLEYVALRAFAFVFRIVPYRVALAFAWVIARLAYHVIRFRVGRAKARIREVFGDETPASRVNRIAWISMRNMCFNAVDVMRMDRISRAWVEANTDCAAALAKVRESVPEGSGAILAIPHTGSWDLAGVSVAQFDFPIFFITGRQHNPLTDAYVQRMRGHTGITTIPRGDATLLRQVIRNLKAEQWLGFMTDLRARSDGVKVRFLGKEAHVVAGMAMFARQAKVPIIPAVARREGWMRHSWEVFDPVVADPSLSKEEDFQRMTQIVIDHYDHVIRSEPEQYFWYNNRWVLYRRPEGGFPPGAVINK